ncbi:TetR family transcriptional regulator [Mycobacterium malmoense]|uniref:TetR family transcriptional regulator n=1 Tax=Mycobacterium malmoense TaxID=1780 RepID=A0A1B9D6I9_MYCMA|nr:TetR/AcrR family transcriptional regulator [Mycobacterium malmoense]OCB27504.1 TetR family transcriptional regulator [Mycobacterium malmoense]OCB30893.1 TetR family transcriptional regulator [Mycobacterium malmoense]OCB34714.1 TetR family transcriptional regulator [Mycobacterium malmoense]OCB50693.1 TetR family transcriptional regulator [Mycobacterium malmoense]
MASPRRVANAKTQSLILDAAERLMLEEGWAAVTSRRVAEEAGLGSQLVHYHFGSMDDLLRAVFQRTAEHGTRAHAEALQSAQPLWALWQMIRDAPFSKWTIEVLALANHRPQLAAQLRHYAETFRAEQAAMVAAVLKKYEVDEDRVPPMAVAFLMTVIPPVLFMENQLDITAGHAEIVGLVERYLREVEGDPPAP